MYKVYETIPPLVTSWYTILAKVIVIVATYRRVVTQLHQLISKTKLSAKNALLDIPLANNKSYCKIFCRNIEERRHFLKQIESE